MFLDRALTCQDSLYGWLLGQDPVHRVQHVLHVLFDLFGPAEHPHDGANFVLLPCLRHVSA